MSNCLVKTEIFKNLTTIAQHIAQHDLNGVHSKNIFDTLINDAINSGASSGEEFTNFIRPYEEEILDIREANGEKVKKKDGSYCYTKVSQNSTYRSNKSVICKALDNGVALKDAEGAPMGKTALEKAYKSAPKSTSSLSAFDRARRGVVMIANSWNDLSAAEKDFIDTELGKLSH